MFDDRFAGEDKRRDLAFKLAGQFEFFPDDFASLGIFFADFEGERIVRSRDAEEKRLLFAGRVLVWLRAKWQKAGEVRGGECKSLIGFDLDGPIEEGRILG